jgi:ABC-type transport system involved in multi-copper enzyme maturation permease subunit
MNLIKNVVAVEAIAINTFRESVRDRIIYAFIVFAFIFTIMGIVLGSLSVGQDMRILQDLGLATVALIGGIIAIFLGTTLVYKEIERRTIYLILTKPIKRWQFIAGKYFGLSLSIFVVTFTMGAFLVGIVAVLIPGHHLQWHLVASIALIYLELLFVIAIATFFSTFATPIMSVLFTLCFWLIGHMGQALLQLGKLSLSPVVGKIAQIVYWFMPDLALLTQLRAYLSQGLPIDYQVLFYLVTYILAYIVLLLALSTLVTERREFP